MGAPTCFLFGSAARGDADAASDIDVLLVYPDEPQRSERELAKRAARERLGKECAFAEYTWSRLSAMFADGHLFAWHLYHEAKRLDTGLSATGNSSFPRPGPYRSARLDAANFLGLLGSCIGAVEDRPETVTYEAGLAYVAVRNIGMSLSALALPRPGFDRHVPFRVTRALGESGPCDERVYASMIEARHASQRGLPAPNVEPTTLLPALRQACDWAERALRTTHDIAIV